jgi:hypothetical protein
MKKPLHPVPLLCIFLFIFQHFASANELYPISLTERINNSVIIAEGKVISQHCFTDPRNGNIYTSSQVTLYRIFKGSVSTEEIEIITHGGSVGNRSQVYSSYLSLATGQSGIFFCMPTGLNIPGARKAASYMVYSSMQGFIAYDTHQQTAADPFTRYSAITDAVAAVKGFTKTETRIRENPELRDPTSGITLRPMAEPTISGFSPTTIPAGTGAILTITGTNFNAVRGTGSVGFRNADNGGTNYVMPLATDYVSWTDTEIQVRVPSSGTAFSGAGTGTIRVINSDPDTVVSAAILTIPYSYSNPQDGTPKTYIPVHYGQNGIGGYTFRMETNFAANTAARASFVRAMDTWVCNTQMNWYLGATTTIDSSVNDGVNVIRFELLNELPAGVLAVCISNYGLCGSPAVAVVTDIDMIFDNQASGSFTWEYGPATPSSSEVDFQTVALHELGHGHQLSHVISPGAVMHYSISKGQTTRTLSANDITGGNLVTSNGFANTCGAPVMTPGEVYTLAGTAGGSRICVNSTVSGGGTEYVDTACNVSAKVLPSGASPVSGTINVCTELESGLPNINSQPYCERHYDIEPAVNAGTATGTITLYFTQPEFNTYNAGNGAFPDLPTGSGDAAGIANLRITQCHGTSGTGLPGSYSGATELIDPADGGIVWNATANRWEITFNVAGFSGFFVHTGSSALPLRLLQFSGTISGTVNVLQWTTADEQHTAYFDIQRSIDGTHFTTVGQVLASGFRAGDKTYQYTDDVSNNNQPVYFYRLKMVDDNARFTYSSIVRLKRNGSHFLVKVLQNPFHEQLQVAVTSPELQEAVITLTDMNGRKITQRTVALQNGYGIFDIPGVQMLRAGAYVLTLVTTSEKQVIKVVKQQ